MTWLLIAVLLLVYIVLTRHIRSLNRDMAALWLKVRLLESDSVPPAKPESAAPMDKFEVAGLTRDAIDKHVSTYHRGQHP